MSLPYHEISAPNFQKLKKPDAVRMVSGAGAALSRGLELGSAADKYIGLCAPRIAQSMLHAVKSGIANRIFLTPWAFATGS